MVSFRFFIRSITNHFNFVSPEKPVQHGDSWELMQRRWSKLEKDFKTKKGQYDISKIPDIYDCIKYDLQHNHHQILFQHSEELYKCSKYLADVVIPQVTSLKALSHDEHAVSKVRP